MDCRETQAMLTAFHDGELPGADRARVEDHLRGCPECGARLADLARVDAAANVPDPGREYWDRFNARVMDRVGRKAEGPKAAALRPKHGWMRRQLRYLVPAAAVAAMVMAVVRYGGLHPGAPAPVDTPVVREPAVPGPAERRVAKAERDPAAAIRRESSAPARRVPEESPRIAGAPAAPHPPVADERSVTAARGERDRLPGRPPSEAKEGTSRDRAAAPAGIDAPSPAAEPQVAAREGSVAGMRIAEDRAAEAPAAATPGKSRSKAGASPPASAAPRAASPCELARAHAARGRWKEAETAQRACLAQDRSAPAQERGLVFLAELLDRQERFAEADAVIKEVDRQFPQSRPLETYRQQRPMTVPAGR